MNKLLKYFYPIEIISFAYIILTAIYIVIFSHKIDNTFTLLQNRLIITALLVGTAYLNIKLSNSKLIKLIRYLLPASIIVYWYPETYYINECIFPNLDHLFIHVDEVLFGCQPSLKFSEFIPYHWFSELMSFGYFSYFLILIFIAFYFYSTNELVGRKALFIILCSFFFYYIMFILLPVVGPQFYHGEPQNQVPDGYLFRTMLKFVQSHGEKPTGAFPSSHVGISLIFLILIYKNARRFFIYFLPVVIILIFSTVYIKAHYVIDVIGGILSVPIVYGLSSKCWGWFAKRVTNS